jgi:hypothetical protein
METGHEDISGPWQTTDKFRPHSDDLTDPGAHRQVLVALALNGAGVTADALLGILKKVILAH